MVIGLGIDLVEIERIERSLARFGSAFLAKILHESEREALGILPGGDTAKHRIAERVAARFAAKEAAVKALGTGMANGIFFQDVRILSSAQGKPELFFHNAAKARADALGVVHAHVSLTHSQSTAGAVVVLDNGS